MQRWVTGHRYVIGAASLLGVAVLSYLVSGLLTPGQHSAVGATPCFAADNSYLPLPSGFEQITNTTISKLPLKAPSAVSPGSGGFNGGRLVGFINRVALTEPYISEERARAASLGYHLGKWPLVPLEGPVVRATPGILELYQAHFDFTAQGGAVGWAKHLTDSARLDPHAHEVALELPAEAVTFETTMGPNDGQHEHAVLIYGSRGTVAFQLSIQGGDGITSVSERNLIVDAISRLESACGNRN